MGAAWLTGASLGAKFIGMFSQLALAWLLGKKEFGAVGLAYTIAAIVGIVQQLGLGDILIHRHVHFERWVTPAFWMSATMSMVAAGMMLGGGTLAAHLFHAPQLPGLLAVIALGSLAQPGRIVARAKLDIDLRFRALAVWGVISSLLTAIFSVSMAWLGCGPYSFVAPMTIVAVLSSIVLWVLARPTIRWSLRVRRWRYLLSDAGAIFATNGLQTLIAYGDYLSLGLFHNQAIVGVYFFAFNLSMQVAILLSGNLTVVLFPALAHLGSDPARQRTAFIRASLMLGIVVVPLLLGQALLGGPVLRLIYGNRWADAVTPFTFLSIGTVFAFLGGPATSMIKARGGFGLLFRFGIVGLLVFFGLVIPMAWRGGPTSVAIAVAIYYAIFGPWGSLLALGGHRTDWPAVIRIYVPILVASGIACAVPALIMPLLPKGPWGDLGRVVLSLALAPAIYVPIIWNLERDICRELLRRLRDLINRLPITLLSLD